MQDDSECDPPAWVLLGNYELARDFNCLVQNHTQLKYPPPSMDLVTGKNVVTPLSGIH